MKNSALIVAGIIFGIIAVIHLCRLYFHFPIVIGNTPVPIGANVIGLIVAGALSVWMFIAASKK